MITAYIKKHAWFLVFVIVTLLGLLVRFMNYHELVNFHLDPPLYMHDVKNVIDSGKISLIGPPVTSKNVDGRMFFTGPLHYHVLTVLGILSGWNILGISVFYTMLPLFTFVLIYFWFRKFYGNLIALLIYSILIFYPPIVSMSRGIWNPHFVPLFGAAFLMFLSQRLNKIQYLFAGLFLGFGFNVHYATVIWILVAVYYLVKDIYLGRFKFINWIFFVVGIIIAEFPLIIFEFRHNFYNLQTILFHLKYGSVSVGYSFAHSYYYIFTLLPILAYILANLLYKLRFNKYYPVLVIFLIAISICGLINSFGSEGQKPLYPDGWTITRQQEVAKIIIKDGENEFEVAETINSDTRALDLRWWLRMSNIKVMNVVNYDIAPVLYLVTTDLRPPEKETVWEVKVMKPFEIEFKKDVGGGIMLYKLVRT